MDIYYCLCKLVFMGISESWTGVRKEIVIGSGDIPFWRADPGHGKGISVSHWMWSVWYERFQSWRFFFMNLLCIFFKFSTVFFYFYFIHTFFIYTYMCKYVNVYMLLCIILYISNINQYMFGFRIIEICENSSVKYLLLIFYAGW